MERSESYGTQETSHREDIVYTTSWAEDPPSTNCPVLEPEKKKSCGPCRKEEVKLSSSVCWREGRQGAGLKGKQREKIKLTLAGEEGKRKRNAFSSLRNRNRAVFSPKQCFRWYGTKG